MNQKAYELPSDLTHLGDSDLEEWFLNRVEEPAPHFDALTAILAAFQARGHTEKAETCADLLHDALSQRRDEENLLALWELRAEWHSADPAFAAVCAAKLGKVFQGQSRMETLLRNAGFDRNLPAAEGLRRLRTLRGLKPGALCWEKTWKLGTVIDIAEYDQQVRIDFEKKKAHPMSLAYAAESLTVLAEDHLLARHRRDPAGVAEWLKQDPAGVVKSALQSFGPLSALELQELLAGRIFPEADWKRFWELARKNLKKDPLVEFPGQRGDPIRLLAREKTYDANWLNALAAERDFDLILGQIEDWKNATAPAGAGDIPPPIRERLDFIIQGAGQSQADKRAHALLLADENGLLDTVRNAPAHLAALSVPATLVNVLHQLPVALIRRWLLLLVRRDRDQTANLLFEALPELAQSPFNETVETLLESGAEARLIETLRARMAAGRATPEMIFWLCRHATFAGQHAISTMGRLALAALNAVESDTISGERLKAKNQLRSLLEQADWLPATLGAMEDLDRRQLISRLQQSPAWTSVERHALLYRLTQACPDLQKFMVDAPPEAAAPTRRFTSLRSFRERQTQLHKLVTEEIPRNSRDIATARSYGDLSENFEYKSARETQGILLRRQQEFEAMLKAMTSTDFEGFPAVTASMGACVTLAHPDGRRERYAILGEWDNEERLGIISCKSKLAEALSGHQPGDQVEIPTESGPKTVTIAAVEALPPEIKAWINEAK